MSALLQYSANKVHAVSDDLESFLHVLNWCALKYLPHSLTGRAGLPSYFHHIYDKAFCPASKRGSAIAPDFEVEGPEEKLTAVRNGFRVVQGFPKDYPLDGLLNELTALCKNHYDTIDFGALLDDPEPIDQLDGDDEPDTLDLPDDLESLPPGMDVMTSVVADPPGPEPASQPESPLQDHNAFLNAFHRAAVSTPTAKWRRAHFGKTPDQIPSLNSLGSIAGLSTTGTGSKHPRQLALPTLSMEIAERDESLQRSTAVP